MNSIAIALIIFGVICYTGDCNAPLDLTVVMAFLGDASLCKPVLMLQGVMFIKKWVWPRKISQDRLKIQVWLALRWFGGIADGLSSSKAQQWLQKYVPNQLVAKKKESEKKIIRRSNGTSENSSSNQ